MPRKRVYLDHAATTPVNKQVVLVMLPFFEKEFGNPSNLYELSRKANDAIAKSKKTITKILNCEADELIFTGTATEADNLAILGVARAFSQGSPLKNFAPKGDPSKPFKIITSQIEHKAILASCDALEKEGFEIVRLPVLKNGLVDLNELKKELDEKTILISITYADSETGTIQPISKISEIIRNFRESRIMNYESSKKNPHFESHNSYFINHNSFPYLHTDASQAAGYLDIDVNKLGVDMMTISAHKIYGPKGIGGLYIKKGTRITPVVYGGGQQNKLRSGTENVAGIVGFAKALEINEKYKKQNFKKVKKLRDILEKGIFQSVPKVILNGHSEKRLPNFLNISILDIEGEAILLYLDELGIMVATGSACNSSSLEPSYILTALGRSYEYIHGSIRFSLGRENTMADIKYVLKVLPKIIKKLRDMSPLNLKLNQEKSILNSKAFIDNQTPHFVRKSKIKNQNEK